MYDLPQGEKIQCLRSMDRLQWNHQVVSNLEEPDVTESCLHVAWVYVLFFVPPTAIEFFMVSFHSFLPPHKMQTRDAHVFEEILAVLAQIDPMERPTISSEKHGGR